MKMSANENESVDIRFYANRRSNLTDLEEFNRMERPSRVFNSRHIPIPPMLTDTNNMEQNEHFRRSRDYSSYYETINSTRIGGSTTNGETLRNRSPFVRFTITDPETHQITAAGQIPLSSPPPIAQANTPTSNIEVNSIPISDESDEEPYVRHYIELEQRRLVDQFNSMVHPSQHLRNSRSGRRSRRFLEHPYFLRNNLDNTSNIRTHNNRHRVRFTSINRGYFNDHHPDRSLTPEQELPEVLEQDIEPETQDFEEVYQRLESLSSMSSLNDADSSDERRSTNLSVSENANLNNSNADDDNIRDLRDLRDRLIPIDPSEVPRIRVVPFILSPTPFNPQIDSPPTTSDMPNTNLINTSTAIPFIDDDDEDNQNNTVFRGLVDNTILSPPIDYSIIPDPPLLLNSVVHSDIRNNSVSSRLIDVVSNNTENGTVTNAVNANETNSGVNIQIDPRFQVSSFYSCVEDQPRVTEETTPVRVEEHPETYEDLNDQLIRLFECPVCFEHIAPPIYQCLLGHLICNKCVLMCENCPTCRNSFNSKRNLYMEKVGYLVKFPCRNALTGCKQQMFIGQKEIHEKECCYRHYQCFFTNCAWKGYYPELHVHMINNHSICILNGSDQCLDILLPGNNQTYKWFLIAHGEYFAIIVHTSVAPRRVKVQVNFIGPTIKAKLFKFTIVLTQSKDRGMSQKLMYERLTLPYSEIYEMSNNNGLKKDIFNFPNDVLEPFIKKSRRRLPIVLKIDPVPVV